MARWFRMYNETLDDPKVQKLSAALFRDWVNILCLASRHDGILPPLNDVAFALRKSEQRVKAIIDSLSNTELLDVTDTGITPHNWNGRQYKSDVIDPTNNERQKRFRKRHRNAQSNGKTVTDTVIPKRPDSDTDSESEQIQIQKEEFKDSSSEGIQETETDPYDLGPLARAVLLQTETFEKARKLAPRYDVYHIERCWRDWNEENGVNLSELANPDKAFLGFVKTHMKANPI